MFGEILCSVLFADSPYIAQHFSSQHSIRIEFVNALTQGSAHYVTTYGTKYVIRTSPPLPWEEKKKLGNYLFDQINAHGFNNNIDNDKETMTEAEFKSYLISKSREGEPYAWIYTAVSDSLYISREDYISTLNCEQNKCSQFKSAEMAGANKSARYFSKRR